MIQILSPSRHLISFNARAKNFSRISRMDVFEKSRFSLPISEHSHVLNLLRYLSRFIWNLVLREFFLIKPSHHNKVSKYYEGKFRQ